MQNPFASQGRRGAPRYHPGCPALGRASPVRANGRSRHQLLIFTGGACPHRLRTTGEFGLGAPMRRAGLSRSPARCRMAYYSCPGLLIQLLVDPVGFEPTTFSMPLRRAPSCAMGPRLSRSGPGGIRTRDLFSAIEARSQLRYRPASVSLYLSLIESVKRARIGSRRSMGPRCSAQGALPVLADCSPPTLRLRCD
jgi:hypothetical protein